MLLSKRLQAVADLISPCELAADIGCDHAYLSIYLVQNHIASHVIASDINEGPLKIARRNIEEAHLENCIETIQCDGIKREAETYVVSGMGGQLMAQILEEGMPYILHAKELILQPQSELMMFRKRLAKMGFSIAAEDMVYEDGKYYPMMKAIHGTMRLTETQAMYGPKLLQEKNAVLISFLHRQKEQLQDLANNLRTQNSARSLERLSQIEAELQLNEEVLRITGD